jgi:hypothetical protein
MKSIWKSAALHASRFRIDSGWPRSENIAAGCRPGSKAIVAMQPVVSRNPFATASK